MKTGRKRNAQKKRWVKLPTLVSMISITMVLLLLGSVVLFALTANELSKSVRESLTVTVVLQDDIAVTEAKAFNDSISALPFVKHSQYISSEQALEEQSKSMGLDPSEFLGSNPFSISLELAMKHQYNCSDSLNWIVPGLKSCEAVHDVIYQHELVDTLNRNLNRISAIFLVIALLLILVSMSLINNMVRISIHNHRFDIYTMKLVGADWSFIRKPFMARAALMGFFSAVLADVMLLGGVEWIISKDPSAISFLPMQNVAVMAVCVFLFGLVLTLLCTYVSVTRILGMRESDLY
ncbi:MAG: permease-like cell division protein FtsX [Bacteroidaceae bacterium]|jgi:cell division transport system permease protein|nr:permease-like cell division protein FtsX [Bacteroidaceae bacterium]MBQ5740270.1 permease-like cell division protein FtsX [Bacteroidaceae bacterium]MBR4405375.1 permease-like cell division protein FtsX [Bacteroidaceae bacterium]MBR4856640.1 permease-like cell division protein FtsX [Bacteroidaceae bacterium]MBR4931360.1 permease-like cell division protein FtsX [Bacteroidaceae bacterium]